MDCYTLFNEIGLNKDGIKIQLIFVNCLSKHKLNCISSCMHIRTFFG